MMVKYPMTSTDPLPTDDRYDLVVKFNEAAARDFIALMREKDPELKDMYGLSSTAWVMQELLNFKLDG